MDSQRTILNSLLAKPNAYLIINQVEAILQQEKDRRTQFYKEITEQEKVEFINGDIVTHSPVMKRHNDATGNLLLLIRAYVSKHQLGFVGFEKVMISLTRNDYEPDICYFTSETSANFKETQVLFPKPDLVVEVLSESTKHRDRGVKFKDYQAHGIQEYWIIDPDEQSVELYRMKDATYTLVKKSNEGTLKSEIIKDFSIPIQAIFDEQLNFQALSQIMKA